MLEQSGLGTGLGPSGEDQGRPTPEQTEARRGRGGWGKKKKKVAREDISRPCLEAGPSRHIIFHPALYFLTVISNSD